MSCVHVVEVEWVHALLYLRKTSGFRALMNICLLKFGVGGPRTEVISVKGAGKTVNGGLGEEGRVGAVQERDECVTYNLFGGTRGVSFFLSETVFLPFLSFLGFEYPT